MDDKYMGQHEDFEDNEDCEDTDANSTSRMKSVLNFLKSFYSGEHGALKFTISAILLAYFTEKTVPIVNNAIDHNYKFGPFAPAEECYNDRKCPRPAEADYSTEKLDAESAEKPDDTEEA